MPSLAPGNMHDATTMTTNNINKVGMSSFEARSMPPRTPRQMTKYVMKRMATVQKIGRRGDVENSVK